METTSGKKIEFTFPVKVEKKKKPPHEKAATVNLLLDFIGGPSKDYPYAFWLKRLGRCSYGDAISIIKEFETLPIKYNKAGAIINRLKKLNGQSKPKGDSTIS
jgi:hypothetical protein